MGFEWDKQKEEIVYKYKDFIKKKDVKLFYGIPKLLAEIKEKGLLLAIGSSNREKNIYRTLEKYKLVDIFDYILAHEDDFDPKPSPDMIHIISEKLGIPEQDMVYIGDTVSDIKSAKSAGAVSIVVTWGFRPKEKLKKENPDFIVHNIKELKKVILNGRL